MVLSTSYFFKKQEEFVAAKIKLKRIGTKNRPAYRVVVQDESASPNSSIIEILGQYNPLEEPVKFEVNKEKVLDWIKKGAQPTEKVRVLLGKAGVMPPVSFEGKTKKKPKSQPEAAPAESAPKSQEPAEEKKEEVQETEASDSKVQEETKE
jgi:small subunit ribosomal protein S16